MMFAEICEFHVQLIQAAFRSSTYEYLEDGNELVTAAHLIADVHPRGFALVLGSATVISATFIVAMSGYALSTLAEVILS